MRYYCRYLRRQYWFWPNFILLLLCSMENLKVLYNLSFIFDTVNIKISKNNDNDKNHDHNYPGNDNDNIGNNSINLIQIPWSQLPGRWQWQQWKKQQASQCHGGSDFAKSPPALMICVHQCVRSSTSIYVSDCVYMNILVLCVFKVWV